jgi:hypothetical protein
MHTNLNLFRERFTEACRVHNMTESKLCSGIGLSGRRGLRLSLSGPGAIDVYRLCQIADALDVSVDWLTGRSNVMEMPDIKPPPRHAVKRSEEP